MTPLRANDLTVTVSENPGSLPDGLLRFGHHFSPHMFEVDWEDGVGWTSPRIVPFHDLTLCPSALVLHYALECFEGLKAFKGTDGKIRLFRPEKNMERMNRSLARLYLPTFDGDELLSCLKELLRIDADWVPDGDGQSMYIRPTAIATDPCLGVHAANFAKLFIITSPVGTYWAEGFRPIKLYANHEEARAWPKGTGDQKVGGNYAPTIKPAVKAAQKGCHQVLWLHEQDGEQFVTEVGAMNIFFVLDRADGRGQELCTAPLTRGDILPGVTRLSVLELARQEMPKLTVSERDISMSELREAHAQGRLREAFGAGTAVLIAPVCSMVYRGEELHCVDGSTEAGPVSAALTSRLTDIMYGKVDHPWAVPISS